MVEANPVNKDTPGAKRCKRPGCNKYYHDSHNDGAACRFHSGKPIFHDQRKGWTCCNQIVYSWEEFEQIVGCCMGQHTDDKSVAETGFF